MRTLAKILRTISRWLSSPAWVYGAPRGFAPWYYFGPSYYRYPSRSDERRSSVRSAR
jgi:hypothetical protein